MKIRIMCRECFEEGQKKDKGKTPPFIPSYSYWNEPVVELDKWPYLEMTCLQGHRTRVIIGCELYELLFQQATYCIMDSYYREAIATYNASLERFMEYACEIITLTSLGRENAEEFGKVWKKIEKQSERQLGAYYSLWTYHFKQAPAFLDEKMTYLRNQVVHQGKLASRTEAESFGKYVFNYIRQANKQIEENIPDAIRDLSHMARHMRLIEKDLKRAEADPIIVTKDGKEWTEGIGNILIPTFLKTESIQSYAECFDVKEQKEFGLIK